MPLYQFKCGSCGYDFEEVLSFKEHDTFKKEGKLCPNCGKLNVKQRMSNPVFNTHGRGFEKTGRV